MTTVPTAVVVDAAGTDAADVDGAPAPHAASTTDSTGTTATAHIRDTRSRDRNRIVANRADPVTSGLIPRIVSPCPSGDRSGQTCPGTSARRPP